MRTKIISFISLVSMICLACVCPFLDVFKASAAEDFQTEIELHAVQDGTPLDGMQWRLYRVAELDENQKAHFVGGFEEIGDEVDIADIVKFPVSWLTETATTLENYTIVFKKGKGIAPDDTAVVDENGQLTFNIEEKGIYLITGKNFTVDTKKNHWMKYTATPMFVCIDDAKNGQTITVSPKLKSKKINKNEPDIKYTLYKKWEGDPDRQEHNEDLAIELYKDGEYETTVFLNNKNNWKYQWKASADVEYRVFEPEVDSRYQVSYLYNEFEKENQIIITVKNVRKGSRTIENYKEDTSKVMPEHEDSSMITPPDNTNSGIIDGGSDVDSSTPDSSYQTDSAPDKVTTPPPTGGGFTGGNNGGGKLPQTGQLWWPVPVLALVGVIFIAFGVRLSSKKNNTN